MIVWNIFDFGANIRDEGGVKGRNNKGLITYDRKIKKDAFYMYKAHWSDEKFVHITSKRFADRADDAIKVKAYSNCNEVTLYINGAEVSTQDGVVLADTARFNKVMSLTQIYEAPEAGTGSVAAISGTFQGL